MTIYSVCVGKFKETSEANKELKKINAAGYKGFLFSMGDFYTLKVVMTPFLEKAEEANRVLLKKGFASYIKYA